IELAGDHLPVVVQYRDTLGEVGRALQSDDVADRRCRAEVLDELGDTAVVPKDLLHTVGATTIPDDQFQTGNQVRRLPGTIEQPVEIDGGLDEKDLRIGPELDPSPGDP